MERVPYDKMQFVWITNHYDIHLEGYCRHNGELAKFVTWDNTDYREMDATCPYCSDKSKNIDDCHCTSFVNVECEITPLTALEKVSALAQKKAFEACVGTHWSYDEGKRGGDFKGFTPLTRFYFWLSNKLRRSK